MTCPELEDRLFDEDCRSALLGRGEMPRDLADHLARCPACVLEWSRAASETSRLSRGLLVDLPGDLRNRLGRAFPRAAGGQRREIDCLTEVLPRALAFGAVAAGLAAGIPGLSEWAAFALGVSLGIAVEAVRRAPASWPTPVAALSLTLRRGLSRLVRVV